MTKVMDIWVECDAVREAMGKMELDELLADHGRYPGAVCNTVKRKVGEIDGKQVIVMVTDDPDETV